ncbi:MAG: hypothetical protein NT080_05390 [Spirochaetes bacterium]|nr:hypothetical protein [Spirochaetota bacterium]
MSSTEWRERKYEEIYESVLRGLRRRTEADSSFTAEEAEGVLRHLYVQEGNDQGGRGELQDIMLAASIAAHEHFIGESTGKRGADA